MKFLATIKYNFNQSREAKLMGDKNITQTEIEFTFQDLIGNNFTMRELVIPWLMDGNDPILIQDK